jgi:dihydroneopterin aldolase
MLKIGFDGLKIRCIIGILPQERLEEQEIFVNVRVTLSRSGSTDILDSTVDYRLLARIAEELARDGKYQLVETLAENIASAYRKLEGIQEVFIRICKPSAIPNAKAAVVEYFG